MLHSTNCTIDNKDKVFNKNLLFKRIRIPVKSVYRNSEMAQKIINHMLMLKGIIQCTANPITGKVLIIFNENLVKEINIEDHLKIFVHKSKISKQGNVIKLNRQKNDMEAALPIAVDEMNSITGVDEKTAWHNKNLSTVALNLGTNIKLGLNNNSISKRINEFGFNVLSEKKKKSFFSRFLRNMRDFSTKLLFAVGGISLATGQLLDAAAILGIILMETTLSTVQQNKAENSIYSLKDMMVHKAKVIRNGRIEAINSKYLIPGDIILLEAGEKIPADARIVECNNLKTSESSLTGESIPVSKSPKICEKYSDLANRFNMVYMGSDILSGNGKAIVVATGMNTEIGKIAAMLQNINAEPTPLQKRMISFTNSITKLCISLCFISGIVGLLMRRPIREILTMLIGFSIGAMPESLPAIVTIAMAISVQRMAKRKAIVRKLPSVETLGCANVICCDKTGTLTMNEMTVRKIYVDKTQYNVSGTGYEPTGEIKTAHGVPINKKALEKLLKCGALCNNSNLSKDKNQKWTINGDPTEGALIVAAKKLAIDVEYIKKSFKRLQEIPFDSSRRYMIIVVDTPDGRLSICKGATSEVIKNCRTVYEDGDEKLLTSSYRDELSKICNNMCENALRTLAFSFKKLGNSPNENIESNHVFLGIVGMEDPPRDNVKKSIKKCHNAGIKVVMITGDNKNTAAAIGKELGLLTNGLILSGAELDSMSDQELDSKIRQVQIFARTSPEQKLRIVKAFKRFGYIVAMTGDGVNDAPAIKEANIGIAMGRGGSDVAKDAASLTLVDDNFSTIVNAIEEGRAVSSNIQRSVKYLLSGSLGEIIAIFLSSIVTGSLPLLSMQIILVNVICESILGSPLAVEAPNEDVMNNPPMRKDAPIIDKKLGKQVLKRGVGIGLSTFAAYEIPILLGMKIAKARTLAFTTLIFTQIVNCYYCRGRKNIKPNKYMSAVLLSSAALFIGILYIPFISSLIATMPLNIMDLTFISALTILSRI